ncbi:MAG: DinB family protein [Anaerolineales bacterium]|jgi:uncharacterized damage-inducible protein DinB
MTEDLLVRLFEHNNWANRQILEVCGSLSDEQLDAEPQSATVGSIRGTLKHFVTSQQHYLALLTLPVEERPLPAPSFDELEDSLTASGEGLLTLVKNRSGEHLAEKLVTTNTHSIAPWVVLLQVINHATEHREQIKSMLTALGVIPPNIDGWSYGAVEKAFVPVES